MRVVSRIAIVAGVSLLASAPVAAQSGKSLAKCEKTIGKEMTKYAVSVQKALAKCLDKVAKEVLDAGDPIADAAKSCASALRKLENSEDATKTLSAKFQAKVAKACDPSSTGTKAAHTDAGVLDPNEAIGLQAGGLDNFCGAFGGDGTLDTTADWIACADEAAVCHALQQVAIQYPRAAGWLGDVATAIGGLDPNEPKYTDALAAAMAVRAQIDSDLDGVPDIACGPEPVSPCGNGAADESGETCDGADLRGLDCTDFGFNAAAGLACTAECRLNLSGCGTDGYVNVDATTGQYSLGYQDNGDGTVSDLSTGLMWEKKTLDGGIHDEDNRYRLGIQDLEEENCDFDGSATTAFLDVLNDVSGSGANCFAGHCDWRLPSLPELKGILLEPESAGGCGTTPCIDQSVFGPSATGSNGAWTSTRVNGCSTVRLVDFRNGNVSSDPSYYQYRVRAVRGGL